MRFILALLLFASPLLARAENDEASCRSRLKHLGGALKAYWLLHDNKSPAKLSDLYLDGLVENLSDFVCPASAATITSASEIDAKGDYTLEAPPQTKEMLVREKTPRHSEREALAIFSDGSIKALALPGIASSGVAKTTPPPATTNKPPIIPPSVTTTAPQVTKQTRDQNPGIVVVTKPPEPETGANQGFRGEVSADLGIRFAFDKEGRLRVSSVSERGLGSMLELRAGDEVTALEDKPIPRRAAGPIGLQELARMAGIAPGDDLILSFRQADGAESIVALPTPGGEPPPVQLIPPGTVVTQQRPIPNAPVLGAVKLGPYVGAGLRNGGNGNGANVAEIDAGSPAEQAGLRTGDLVVAIDGEPIESSAELAAAVSRKSPGDLVNLLVIRNGTNLRIAVRVGAKPFLGQ